MIQDMTDYVTKDETLRDSDGIKFFVDRTNIDTGEVLVKPGQDIEFMVDGETYFGTVCHSAFGRDDDVLSVTDVTRIR